MFAGMVDVGGAEPGAPTARGGGIGSIGERYHRFCSTGDAKYFAAGGAGELPHYLLIESKG